MTPYESLSMNERDLLDLVKRVAKFLLRVTFVLAVPGAFLIGVGAGFVFAKETDLVIQRVQGVWTDWRWEGKAVGAMVTWLAFPGLTALFVSMDSGGRLGILAREKQQDAYVAAHDSITENQKMMILVRKMK